MTQLWMSLQQDGQELLRAVLGREDDPPVGRHPQGKPYLLDSPLEFNLSHSGGYVLCALSDAPVGVDVEVVRPRRGGLPQRTLSEEEYHWFCQRGSQWEDFYTLWTLKEAAVKQTGTGLRQDPRTILVPCLEPGQQVAWQGLWYACYAGQGWRAALCYGEEQPVPLQWMEPNKREDESR